MPILKDGEYHHYDQNEDREHASTYAQYNLHRYHSIHALSVIMVRARI